MDGGGRGYGMSERLSEDDFGPAKGLSALKSFDAFPKTKATYLTRTRNSSLYTVLLVVMCVWLTSSEIRRWLTGETSHLFSVEKGVEHRLMLNVDIVVAMDCIEVDVNVQDAAGDRILAGEKLRKDPTRWADWADEPRTIQRRLDAQKREYKDEKRKEYSREDDVHEFLAKARGRRNYKRTPKLPRNTIPDACRIYGSLDGTRVQGDFHITARGHGYRAMLDHLDHSRFNFSHHINELSFGPFFPSLVNPLDDTQASTDHHFYKFQYYLSVVPTIYTDVPEHLDDSAQPDLRDKTKRPNPYALPPHTMFTNQYAVTEQSHSVAESAVPGVFFKYDIEPILLTISEKGSGFLGLLVRLVNVLAGVFVAAEWLVRLSEWALDNGFLGRAFKRSRTGNLTHGLLGQQHKKAFD